MEKQNASPYTRIPLCSLDIQNSFLPFTQDKHCVSPDLCPCRHNGQWYPPNATIQEDCNIWYAQSPSPVTVCDP